MSAGYKCLTQPACQHEFNDRAMAIMNQRSMRLFKVCCQGAYAVRRLCDGLIHQVTGTDLREFRALLVHARLSFVTA